MRRFNFYLPIDLFNRIKVMSKKYNLSITKMMIHLLEKGYINMLIEGGNEYEINNK